MCVCVLFHGVSLEVRQLKLIDFGPLFLSSNFVSESKTKINYVFLFDDRYTVRTGIDSSEGAEQWKS